MLTVDPDKRATFREVAGHAWTRTAGPTWQRPFSIYAVHSNPATGAVEADDGVLSELEGHGYARSATLRHLAAGDANYAMASYYLLAEAKAEAALKASPRPALTFPGPAPRTSGSSSSTSARARPASSGQQQGRPQQLSTAAVGAAAAGGASGQQVAASARPAVMRPPTAAVAVTVV